MKKQEHEDILFIAQEIHGAARWLVEDIKKMLKEAEKNDVIVGEQVEDRVQELIDDIENKKLDIGQIVEGLEEEVDNKK